MGSVRLPNQVRLDRVRSGIVCGVPDRLAVQRLAENSESLELYFLTGLTPWCLYRANPIKGPQFNVSGGIQWEIKTLGGIYVEGDEDGSWSFLAIDSALIVYRFDVLDDGVASYSITARDESSL